MAERVRALNAALHRYVDPSRSNDPRIRELVARLAALEPAPAPRAHFRAELRAQLVAVAPRLIDEGPREFAPRADTEQTRSTSTPVSAAPLRAAFERVRHVKMGRPLAVVTGVMAIFAVLLGGAVWISSKALPGDSLYGLKRSAEDVQYSLTTGDTPRSKKLLDFARTRAGEVSDLLSQASATGSGPQAGGVSASQATLITNTLSSADGDVRRAAQMLGGQAVRESSSAPLTVMTDWAPGQLQRLRSIVGRIPAGALHQRAVASARLVSAAMLRAQQLKSETGCACLGAAPTDVLGPIPCTVCSSPASPSVQPTQQPTAGTPSSTPGRPSGPSSTTGPSGTGRQTGTGTTSGGILPTGKPTSGLPLPLPTPGLPTGAPTATTAPLNTDSCARVTLGPIGVGTCGVRLHT